MAVTLPNGVVVPNADGREQISATGIDELRVAGASADSAIGAARVFAAAQAAQAEQKALDATQVALDVDTHSRARDAALGDQIAGMEGMTYVGAWEPGRTYRINEVVTHGGDSWARLTAGSQGTPGGAPAHWGLVARRGAGGGFGELSETAVTGLWETVDEGIEVRLARIEHGTGWRILSLRDGVGGQILVKRTATAVKIRFIDVTVPEGIGSMFLTQSLPTGFRHSGEHWFIASARSTGQTSEIGLYGGVSTAWVRNTFTRDSTRPTAPINGEYSWDPIDAYPTTVTLPNA